MAAMNLKPAQGVESFEDVSVCTYQCEVTKCPKPHPSTAMIEVADEFLCGICHEVMINPVSCSEGHAWCKSCIMHWLSNDDTCPVDRQPLSDSCLTKNRLIENMIAKLDVSCYLKSEGCTWIGNRRIYNAHVASCPFTPVSCKYCKDITTCKQIDEHIEVCDQAPVNCSLVHCAWTGERRQLKDHIASCDFRSLRCEYCKRNIIAKDLDGHKKVCDSAPVTCSYASIGCNWSGERRLQEEHVSSCNLRPVLYREDGSLEYEGGLKEDEYGRHVKHGRGKLFNQHGMEYDGEWKENRRHGHGVSYRDDGAIEYEGQWQNGFKHGQGILLNKDGVLVYEGEWKYNRKHGEGVSFSGDGSKKEYEGQWQNNKRHGRGVGYSDDGKKEYEGQWLNNKRHGHGSLYQNGVHKQAEQFWKDGKVAPIPPRVLAPAVGSVTLENAEAYFQLAMQSANFELAAALQRYYTQMVLWKPLAAELEQAKLDVKLKGDIEGSVDRLNRCRQIKEKLDGFPEPKAPSVAELNMSTPGGGGGGGGGATTGATGGGEGTPSQHFALALSQVLANGDYTNIAHFDEMAAWSNIYAGLVEAFTLLYKQPIENVEMNQCLQFKMAIDSFPTRVTSLQVFITKHPTAIAAIVGIGTLFRLMSPEQEASYIQKYPTVFQAFLNNPVSSGEFKAAHCSSCKHRFCQTGYKSIFFGGFGSSRQGSNICGETYPGGVGSGFGQPAAGGGFGCAKPATVGFGSSSTVPIQVNCCSCKRQQSNQW